MVLDQVLSAHVVYKTLAWNIQVLSYDNEASTDLIGERNWLNDMVMLENNELREKKI